MRLRRRLATPTWLVGSLLAFTTHASDLPDPKRTPGALNSLVTQRNIGETICVKGWTRTVRPPVSFTNRLKRIQIAQYGYVDRDPRDVEEDHLIPLSLGGAPDDPANLWPEPRSGRWNADLKDSLEARLHHLVCDGKIPLVEAQTAIRTNWIAAYHRYMSRRAKGNREPE